MNDDQHPWLTPEDSAQILDVNLNHLRVLAHRHKWRRLRHGRHVAYHAQDVLEEKVHRDTLKRQVAQLKLSG